MVSNIRPHRGISVLEDRFGRDFESLLAADLFCICVSDKQRYYQGLQYAFPECNLHLACSLLKWIRLKVEIVHE